MQSNSELSEANKAINDPFKKVGKIYRPEWIDSENKMFINKLNFVCDNFENSFEEVSTLFIESIFYWQLCR